MAQHVLTTESEASGRAAQVEAQAAAQVAEVEARCKAQAEHFQQQARGASVGGLGCSARSAAGAGAVGCVGTVGCSQASLGAYEVLLLVQRGCRLPDTPARGQLPQVGSAATPNGQPTQVVRLDAVRTRESEDLYRQIR